MPCLAMEGERPLNWWPRREAMAGEQLGARRGSIAGGRPAGSSSAPGYGRVRVGGPASGVLPEPETRRSNDPLGQDREAAWEPGTGGTMAHGVSAPGRCVRGPGLLPSCPAPLGEFQYGIVALTTPDNPR